MKRKKNATAVKRKKTRPPRNPDQTVDIQKLIDEVVPDPETWKNTPNSVFGGLKPAEYIGTPREQFLRDVVLAAKYGIYS